MKKSKVSIALQYLKDHPEATPYAAAKHAKLAPTSLYRRMIKDSGICPSCGKPLKEKS